MQGEGHWHHHACIEKGDEVESILIESLQKETRDVSSVRS